ncbi:MAG TPA: hypothetical protein VMT32_10220 [Bryobacteraceae bacterium]|nr:hypothetical protein [Bryobacteraceae bacterium]
MNWRLLTIVLCIASAWAAPKTYPDHWVYVPTELGSDQELARVEGIAKTAGEHGLNGMLLSAGFDALDLKSEAYFRLLQHLKLTCDHLGVEIIPIGFSVGYGGGVLSHDKNLAAGLPVRGALFVAGDHEARFQPDPPVTLVYGGFERREGNLPAGFSVHGSEAIVDTAVFHSGSSSVRFENFAGSSGGEVYLAQPLRVQPYRCYRLRCWVKTEGTAPKQIFHLWAIAPDGRDLAYMEPVLPATSGWQELVWAFNSWYADRVDFRIGVQEGQAGKVWVDDVAVEEVGLANVLRRPGTPVRVHKENSAEVLEEGRDYTPISDPHLNFRWDHDGLAIHLPAGSRIHAGDRLRVDYFHGTTIYRDQVPADMSEPAVYEIWQHQIPLVEKYLAPKKYFLTMDEVRIGGFCEACRRRHLPMAEILGDCLTRQYKMLRAANPKIQIYTWSDMFDPNHNAREKYYLIDGNFRDTWKYIPKDLVITCWYYEKRNLSLDFFSKLGYKTLAGAYYDADDLDNPKGWLESLDRTPGADGIMYTTWEGKYQLLGAFGDLVSKTK